MEEDSSVGYHPHQSYLSQPHATLGLMRMVSYTRVFFHPTLQGKRPATVSGVRATASLHPLKRLRKRAHPDVRKY